MFLAGGGRWWQVFRQVLRSGMVRQLSQSVSQLSTRVRRLSQCVTKILLGENCSGVVQSTRCVSNGHE